MIFKTSGICLVLASAFALAGCGSGDGPTPVGVKEDNKQGAAASIMGGGSSFVYPMMNRWTSDYNKKTGVQVNYQSLGSSGGVKQFSVKTLDFGATDAPMNDEQLKTAKDTVLHVPVIMGAVAITYNLPEVTEPVTLSGPVIADIYLGKIKKWNDPAIAALNPGLTFPDFDIVTVRRADGSGTTFIFADFLGKISKAWKDQIGVGNSLNWPANSIGGKGNEGVAAQVKRSPHSMGYVELVFALQTHMPTAAIVNLANKPVQPSVSSVTAAAAELKEIPDDLRMSITNSPGVEAYPMAGISWIVVRTDMGDDSKGQAVHDFLAYILSDEAQGVAKTMDYSKLPEAILTKARDNVSKIKGTN